MQVRMFQYCMDNRKRYFVTLQLFSPNTFQTVMFTLRLSGSELVAVIDRFKCLLLCLGKLMSRKEKSNLCIRTRHLAHIRGLLG